VINAAVIMLPSCQVLYHLLGIDIFRYWDSTKHCIDIVNMIKDLEQAKEKYNLKNLSFVPFKWLVYFRSVVVLHGCAHNPTGMVC
jgi:aspartate/tyrosine/aromatic aminotransferase